MHSLAPRFPKKTGFFREGTGGCGLNDCKL
jgi:hypothetical protein